MQCYKLRPFCRSLSFCCVAATIPVTSRHTRDWWSIRHQSAKISRAEPRRDEEHGRRRQLRSR